MSNEKPKRKLLSLRNILIASGILLVLCCGLGGILSLFPSSEPTPGTTSAVVALATQPAAEEPASTPVPTDIPKPTDIPEPTNTPQPTETSTPIPTPIELSGQGDSVIDLAKWPGAALLQINYSGSSNFVVWTYDGNGNQIDLLVNTIGNYQGTRPIEFQDSAIPVTRLSIESDGSWQIKILPMALIRREPIPGTVSGVGDDVIFIDGINPDLLKADASQANSNFVIYAYGNYLDLLINEIAPYIGTLPVPSGTIILEVIASGPWTLEITTR